MRRARRRIGALGWKLGRRPGRARRWWPCRRLAAVLPGGQQDPAEILIRNERRARNAGVSRRYGDSMACARVGSVADSGRSASSSRCEGPAAAARPRCSCGRRVVAAREREGHASQGKIPLRAVRRGARPVPRPPDRLRLPAVPSRALPERAGERPRRVAGPAGGRRPRARPSSWPRFGLEHRLRPPADPQHRGAPAGGPGPRLLNRPALLLADEPTGNLDETNAGRVLEAWRPSPAPAEPSCWPRTIRWPCPTPTAACGWSTAGSARN